MYLVIIYNVYQSPHSIVTIAFCGDRILFVIWYRILFVSINLFLLIIFRKWCSFIFLVKEENQFESIKIIVFEIDCTYTVCPRVYIFNVYAYMQYELLRYSHKIHSTHSHYFKSKNLITNLAASVQQRIVITQTPRINPIKCPPHCLIGFYNRFL